MKESAIQAIADWIAKQKMKLHRAKVFDYTIAVQGFSALKGVCLRCQNPRCCLAEVAVHRSPYKIFRSLPPRATLRARWRHSKKTLHGLRRCRGSPHKKNAEIERHSDFFLIFGGCNLQRSIGAEQERYREKTNQPIKKLIYDEKERN